MTDEEYVFRETAREWKQAGNGDRHKKRRGGRYVRLPSDHLSKKELQKMNGECVTYRMDMPMDHAAFKKLPDDIKAEYMKGLHEKYGANLKVIADMLGCTAENMRQLNVRLGKPVASRPGVSMKADEKARWQAFLQKKKPEAQEENANEVAAGSKNAIADLIAALAGTGAKLTIEVVL